MDCLQLHVLQGPQKPYGPQSRKYLLSGPLQTKFANTTLDLHYCENLLSIPSTKPGNLFSDYPQES